jgi:hypothetical protein
MSPNIEPNGCFSSSIFGDSIICQLSICQPHDCLLLEILKDKNKFENLKPTIWFKVEDVAIFYKEMLNNGIKFLSEPFKIGTGNAVEFEDPFGNRLGVTDYIK